MPVVHKHVERDGRRVVGGECVVAGDGPVGRGTDAHRHVDRVLLGAALQPIAEAVGARKVGRRRVRGPGAVRREGERALGRRGEQGDGEGDLSAVHERNLDGRILRRRDGLGGTERAGPRADGVRHGLREVGPPGVRRGPYADGEHHEQRPRPPRRRRLAPLRPDDDTLGRLLLRRFRRGVLKRDGDVRRLPRPDGDGLRPRASVVVCGRQGIRVRQEGERRRIARLQRSEGIAVERDGAGRLGREAERAGAGDRGGHGRGGQVGGQATGYSAESTPAVWA